MKLRWLWTGGALIVVGTAASTLSACSESLPTATDEEAGAAVPTSPSPADAGTPTPVLADAAAADAASVDAATVDAAGPPAITSGEGITVTSVSEVSGRTFDILVSTPSVSAAATSHGNGVRVTLPPGYATSRKRYPVVYYLHGAGGGSYRDNWSGGAVEQIASGASADVIVVMPDGGKGGWYTNWIDQSTIAQSWETYHLTQLVPFIDRNLRTIASRSGRAVSGISMGGFGAMRYAVDRPDLFAAATSISGAIDLENLGVQTAVIAPSLAFGLPTFGAFGNYGILSPWWGAVNPVRRAGALATVATFLYVGAGTDVGEAVVRASTESMHAALGSVAGTHFFLDYGVPGPTPYGSCSGGHTSPCFNFSFSKALPQMLEVLADPY